MSGGGWIGVDFDGTLAVYDHNKGLDDIGAPIMPMVERVKRWRREGRDVRIFTARVAGHEVLDLRTGQPVDALAPVRDWCLQHLGEALPITNVKDFGMIELWDDRAVQVIPNTGQAVQELLSKLLHEQDCSQEPAQSSTFTLTCCICSHRQILPHRPSGTLAEDIEVARAHGWKTIAIAADFFYACSERCGAAALVKATACTGRVPQ